MKLERLLDGGQKLLSCDVARHWRVARPQCLPRLGFIRRIALVASQQRLCDRTTDIEVVQFLVEGLARRLDGLLYLVEVALRTKPQTEPSLWILLWQADRTQQNAEDGKPHLVRGSARQRPRCCEKPACATARRIKFAQQFAQFIRHGGHECPCGRTIRKHSVLPEVAEHF